MIVSVGSNTVVPQELPQRMNMRRSHIVFMLFAAICCSLAIQSIGLLRWAATLVNNLLPDGEANSNLLPDGNPCTENNTDTRTLASWQRLMRAIPRNTDLFRRTFDPLVDELLRQNYSSSCANASLVVPYRRILEMIQRDNEYYDRVEECPLLLVFYYEPGTSKMAEFLDFYGNMTNKRRCIQFITSRRFAKHSETLELQASGYTIVNSTRVKQNVVTKQALRHLRELYGSDTLVTLNDLDHFLVWHLGGKYYRYASYSEILLVYAYDMLSSTGTCPTQLEINERYVLPCTCMLEDNDRYISNEDLVFSQYGVHNHFHPTANFYFRNSSNLSPVGTVYFTLHEPLEPHSTHSVGKQSHIRASHASVVHVRRNTNPMKYMNLLYRKNVDKAATVDDIMACAMGKPKAILLEHKKCRRVKEVANIIAMIHQRHQCQVAGYSEKHCSMDFACCVTGPNSDAHGINNDVNATSDQQPQLD